MKNDQATKQQWGDSGLAPTLTPIPAIKSPVKPVIGLYEGMDYTPAKFTNIMETWRKHGFKPPSELKR